MPQYIEKSRIFSYLNNINACVCVMPLLAKE